MVTYTYHGDRLTDPRLKKRECTAVRRADGKCIRGRNGNFLVDFDGEKGSSNWKAFEKENMIYTTKKEGKYLTVYENGQPMSLEKIVDKLNANDVDFKKERDIYWEECRQLRSDLAAMTAERDDLTRRVILQVLANGSIKDENEELEEQNESLRAMLDRNSLRSQLAAMTEERDKLKELAERLAHEQSCDLQQITIHQEEIVSSRSQVERLKEGVTLIGHLLMRDERGLAIDHCRKLLADKQ